MFILPPSTEVNRFIPKNAFDNLITSSQKKVFTDLIAKIHLKNVLSKHSVNLVGEEFSEIHIFEIVIKQKNAPTSLLQIIDKVNPHYIVFVIKYEDEVMLCASKKHKHPTAENQAVIDWSFTTEWFDEGSFNFQFNLKQSLDYVFEDICFQISGNVKREENITELIALEQNRKQLEKQIAKLKTEIKRCKQFNKKLELNQKLLECGKEMEELVTSVKK